MSMLFRSSFPDCSRAAYQSQVWGEFFGELIRSARETRSRSIEDAATKAGMTISEWAAIEQGTVPRTLEQLHQLADGLDADWDAITGLTLLCRGAWNR